MENLLKYDDFISSLLKESELQIRLKYFRMI